MKITRKRWVLMIEAQKQYYITRTIVHKPLLYCSDCMGSGVSIIGNMPCDCAYEYSDDFDPGWYKTKAEVLVAIEKLQMLEKIAGKNTEYEYVKDWADL